MSVFLTVFTPTYNRAHTLIRLFESLQKQNIAAFEWVIVDDGSTDNTEDVIIKFKREAEFTITYIKQENQGKHIAINRGLSMAKGKYFVVIDSDDYLLNNAVDIMVKMGFKLQSDVNYAGFTFIRFMEDINYDKSKYGFKEWDHHIPYEWEFHGEMIFCYKTEIAKQFPFPKFKGEKFCPESLIHHRIGNQFKVLYTDHVLASGDYLEDGLSAKYLMLLEKNPRASTLCYSEKIKNFEFDRNKRLSFASIYWNIALKSDIPWIKRFCGIPLWYSYQFWLRRFFKR